MAGHVPSAVGNFARISNLPYLKSALFLVTNRAEVYLQCCILSFFAMIFNVPFATYALLFVYHCNSLFPHPNQ